MEKPSFKKQKPYVYILFGLWVLSTLVLTIESCIPGDISSDHSNNFAEIILDFVAIFRPQNVVKYVSPTSIELATENTVLSKEGDKYLIPVSSGAAFKYKVTYPELKEGETQNTNITFKKGGGEQNGDDIYTLSKEVGLNRTTFYVTGLKEAKDCSFQIYCDKTYAKTVSFDIVLPPAPRDDILHTTTPSSFNVKVNESYPINVTMDDGVKKDIYYPDNPNRNEYFSRYYDVRKISSSVEDPSICDISEYGVITGKKEGKTKVHYGPFTFDVTVAGEIEPISDNTKFTYTKDDTILATLDLSTDGSEVNYTFSFNNPELDDSFSFDLVDDQGNEEYMAARVFRKSKNSCYLKGLRGVDHPFFLKVMSSSNPEVQELIPLELGIVMPQTMLLDVNEKNVSKKPGSVVDLDFVTGKKNYINCRFWTPHKYVTWPRTAVKITSEDARVYRIDKNLGNGAYLTFLTPGEWRIRIESKVNENLWYEIRANVIKGRTQLDTNDSDFTTFIRKSFGHFLAFAVDAGFFFLFLYFFLKDKKGLISAGSSVLWGFIFAGITELIQYFIPGRTSAWKDVGIDTAGAASGVIFVYVCILLIYLGCFIYRKIKGKIKAKEEEKKD